MGDIEIKNLDLKLEKGHAVCFDFDGVIHKYSKGWQDGSIYDKANPEALDLMLFLQKIGIPIFICSTRQPEQIISWWNKQGFWCDAVRVNDNETFWKELNLIGVTNRKLPAQMYIDDRAYKYNRQTVKQFILDNSTEESSMEIKVGEWARTKDGEYIGKIVNYSNYEYWIQHSKCSVWKCGKDSIIKHSPNLLKVIEIGDFVNGWPVYEVGKDYVFCAEYEIEFTEEEIETILTHENYEANCSEIKNIRKELKWKNLRDMN